jgi:hypothetical protein
MARGSPCVSGKKLIGREPIVRNLDYVGGGVGLEKITFRRCKLSIGARNAWLLPRCIDRSHRTMRQTLISVLRQNPRGGESGSGPRHKRGTE